MPKIAWRAYLVLLHVVVIVVAARSPMFYDAMLRAGFDHPAYSRAIGHAHAVQRQRDAQVPAGAAVFLGDSITAGLVTAAVADRSVNFGIPGQRSDHLLAAMDGYRSLGRAARVYLMIGTNDVAQGRQDGLAARYRAILAKVPAAIPVVFSSIPPITRAGREEHARAAAIEARAVCAADVRCVFVDGYGAIGGSVESQPGISSDGIHPTADGYRRWAQALSLATSRQTELTSFARWPDNDEAHSVR